MNAACTARDNAIRAVIVDHTPHPDAIDTDIGCGTIARDDTGPYGNSEYFEHDSPRIGVRPVKRVGFILFDSVEKPTWHLDRSPAEFFEPAIRGLAPALAAAKDERQSAWNRSFLRYAI